MAHSKYMLAVHQIARYVRTRYTPTHVATGLLLFSGRILTLCGLKESEILSQPSLSLLSMALA